MAFAQVDDLPRLEADREVVGIAIAAGRGGEDLSALAEQLRSVE